MFKNHIIAFILGFILDRIIGDPYNIPHPIRYIGSLISFFEKKLLHLDGDARNFEKEKRSGVLMCILVIVITGLVTGLITFFSYKFNFVFGIIIEAILTCYILAAKSLKVESMKVYDALKHGTIEDARYAVSMIVGRDTDSLDEIAVAKAAVETVAENTSDGVIAPMIYTFFFFFFLGLMYKAVNTMDSMVGYHNDKYEYFGKAAAKLDDIVNFVPARLSAGFMIMAAFFGGKEYSFQRALKIFIRDRFNHKSPNSAQTESACAGALSVKLAGDASYFGKIVKKPFIGDDIRQIEFDDIKRACRLMYLTEDICLIGLMIIAAAIFVVG